jgi:hypothetical protein
VSKQIASVAEFKCTDWNCRRQATQYNFRTEPDYRDRDKTMAELFAANIYCNIHAGVIKRQKSGRSGSYYQNENLVAIADLGSHWDEAKQAYLDARLAKAQAQQREWEAKRAEADLIAEARFAEAWVERSTEAPFIVEAIAEDRSYGDHFRDGYLVRKYDEGEGAWDSVTVSVEQDDGNPAIVRILSNGNMSPTKARALAQALILAANKADERDILHGPKED